MPTIMSIDLTSRSRIKNPTTSLYGERVKVREGDNVKAGPEKEVGVKNGVKDGVEAGVILPATKQSS